MGCHPYEPLIKLAIQIGVSGRVEKKSHTIDQAYLRWEQVRRNGVPLDENQSKKKITYKTGFEGYFVGSVFSTEKLLEELLKIGEDAWRGILLLHRKNPAKIQELKKQF